MWNETEYVNRVENRRKNERTNARVVGINQCSDLVAHWLSGIVGGKFRKYKHSDAKAKQKELL